MKNIILIGLLFACSFSVKASKIYTYFDMNYNEYLIFNRDKTLSWMVYRNSIEICSKKSEFVCFNSKIISFAIPKRMRNYSDWHYEGILYCVSQRIYDKASKSHYYFIKFGKGNLCSDINKDNNIVFNTKYGLRLWDGNNNSGLPIKIISTDRIGFGGKNKVKVDKYTGKRYSKK